MKIKSLLVFALCSLLFLSACSVNAPDTSEITLASDVYASADEGSQEPSLPDNEPSDSDKLIYNPACRSAVLYCADDKEYIYSDSAAKTTAPASLTKLLTASVMLKYMSPEDIVTVGSEQHLVELDSSKCFISEGNRLTVRDLLTGMLLCSGNDAAYTAAVSTARTVSGDPSMSDDEAVKSFVDLMNQTAAQIGMSDSHFVNPDGWDNEDQYTTAADLVRLAVYAYEIPEINNIVGTFEKSVVFDSGESITWKNTNLLLDPESEFYSKDAVGMKTGTTDKAGCCLIAAFSKNSKTYYSVVTGCGADSERYILTLTMLSRAE